MKNKIYISVFFVFAFAWLLSGINWGLMSDRRKTLVEEGIEDKKKLYSEMIFERENKYNKEEYIFSRWGKEIKDNTIGKSQLFQIIDYSAGYNLKGFYSLIRPFYLRSYHQDEQQAIQPISNMNPKKLDFNPKFYIYGGGYIYPTAFSLGIFNILGFFKVKTDLNYYFENPDEMAGMYIAGRFAVVISIFLQIVLLFLLCRKLTTEKFALFLCLTYLVSPLVTANKNLMKPHLFAQFFSLVMLYYVYNMSINKNLKFKFSIISGLFIGFGAGCNMLNAVLYLIPAGMIVLENYNFAGKLKFLIITGVSVIAGYFIVNPYVIFDLKNYYYEMIYITHYSGEAKPAFSNFFKMTLMKYLNFYLIVLIFCYIILLKKIKMIIKSPFSKIIISSTFFVAIFLSYMAYKKVGTYSLYYMPTLYPLVIITPALLYKSFSDIERKLVFLLISVWMICNLFVSVQYQMDFHVDGSEKSHRITAGEWINKNIKSGTDVGIIDCQPQDIPAFGFSKYKLSIYPSKYNSDIDVSNSEYIICSDYSYRMVWVDELVKSRKYEIIKVFKSDRFYYRLWEQLNMPIYILKKI
ncbi:glycosyltransferase family 39 protein [Candidatus Dependentiae bacterium]|nr:glycosyltransferase family 39 protein [Candidatus Dependentiae bacterium]